MFGIDNVFGVSLMIIVVGLVIIFVFIIFGGVKCIVGVV